MAFQRRFFVKTITSVNQLVRNKSYIRIVEVGPRDGLQNEATRVSTETKIELINKLANTGLKSIEVTSFVSPKWVPQMSDNAAVYSGINKKDGVSYPVLVPNLTGLEAALKVGVKEVAVFLSASEGFSRKNINCSIDDSIKSAKTVIQKALEQKLRVRGYVSCVVGCPYDGRVEPAAVSRIAEVLLTAGCYEISLGDTIGIGTKITVENMLHDVLHVTTPDKLAVHFHDTYGQALVNTMVALEKGVTVADSSVAGLGGCPYAKGATGNVATEDLVYMLHGLGAETDVNLNELVSVGQWISDQLKRPPMSKVNNAMYSKMIQQ